MVSRLRLLELVSAMPAIFRNDHEILSRSQEGEHWSICSPCDYGRCDMYRSGDPRLRRRLDEIGSSLQNANLSAQSGLYDFTQTYVRPCFDSITSCFTTCIDASCPTLNLSAGQRDRMRRQRDRARSRGRAELNFDFYDDWDDDEENDAFMALDNDEFDRLMVGGGSYGTISATQPSRQRGMNYPRGRRKSAGPALDSGTDAKASSSLFAKLFGGKAHKYQPSVADLQDNPGARKDLTEGEALLREQAEEGRRKHRRNRSDTVTSGHTTDSFSSRGDIFPSDEEDDAIPLDDEFAMVLERRTTLSGPGTESSSGHTRSLNEATTGRRPSAGSRRSTQSSRGRKSRSRTQSNATPTPEQVEEDDPRAEVQAPSIDELKQVDRQAEREEEAEVARKRSEAQRLALDRGLVEQNESGEARSRTQPPKQRLGDVSNQLNQLARASATAEEGEPDETADPNESVEASKS